MGKEHKRTPSPLKADAVKRLAEQHGVTLTDLPSRAGIHISTRGFEKWMAGETRPDLRDVDALSRFLGVGVDEIAEVPESVRILSGNATAHLDSAGRWLREKAIVGILVQLPHRLFAPYLKYVTPRFRPLTGWAQEFEDDGTLGNGYAEVVISPRWREHPRGESTFVFGFGLGPLRVDYGQVIVREDGSTELNTFFMSFAERGRCDEGWTFRVWTWFGPEPCRFLVHSHSPFELVLSRGPTSRDAARRKAGTVHFPAAPHHLRVA